MLKALLYGLCALGLLGTALFMWVVAMLFSREPPVDYVTLNNEM